MKKLLLVLLACTMLCFENVAAQVDTLWVKRFNGSSYNDDEAKIIRADQDGFIYVAGNVYPASGIRSYGVIKYTPEGDTLWVRYFNSIDGLQNELNDMAIDTNHNIIVTGTNFRTANSDYATVKWDSDGNLLWAERYDGGDIDFAYAVTVDQPGNIYVTGTSWKPNQSYNYMTIKYNPDGDIVWTHTFFGNDDAGDIPGAILVDHNGNVIVSGSSDWRWGSSDIVTIKLNNDGGEIWTRQYNSPQNGGEGFSSMGVDGSDNIYIAGVSDYDIIFIKYSSSGDTIWTRKYIGPGNGADQIFDIVVDHSGNIYAAGKTYDVETWIDFLTVKYDSAGELKWVKTYAGIGNYGDYAESISLDNPGNVYVTGTTAKSSINTDYVTVKYDTAGNEQWNITYKGPDDRNDYANSVCVDDSGYIYVTGMSGSTGSGFDFATVKYTQTPNQLQPDQQIFPDEFRLCQNYPNPFNPSTTIEFSLSKSEFVELKVYNILGKEVASLVSKRLDPGNHSYTFEGSNLANGVYYYAIQAGGFYQVRKMVLLK